MEYQIHHDDHDERPAHDVACLSYWQPISKHKEVVAKENACSLVQNLNLSEESRLEGPPVEEIDDHGYAAHKLNCDLSPNEVLEEDDIRYNMMQIQIDHCWYGYTIPVLIMMLGVYVICQCCDSLLPMKRS